MSRAADPVARLARMLERSVREARRARRRRRKLRRRLARERLEGEARKARMAELAEQLGLARGEIEKAEEAIAHWRARAEAAERAGGPARA